MTTTLDITKAVFGVASENPEVAAAKSTRTFVRDQDHVAFFKQGATGRVLTAVEAIRAFGIDKLYEAWEYGAAIIVASPDEPGATIRNQREALGLSQEQLARATNLPVGVIEDVELGKARQSIHAVDRIAQALALDDSVMTWIAGAHADGQLAVRLRDYSSGGGGLSPSAVAALCEAAWIARTEARLRSWLGPVEELWRSFDPLDDFGNSMRPAWRVGYWLAEATREKLRLGQDAPITSLRELVGSLGIVLIQSELPHLIAGATISVDAQRAIVVNVNGANSNPWIRRATVAHELGHLIWDPDQRLNHLKVDSYGDLQNDYAHAPDRVEARANAFAIAFLAPPRSVIRVFGQHEDPTAGLRGVMETFGLSMSAARHHVENSHNNAGVPLRVDLRSVRCSSSATQDWVVSENMTLDWFPVQSTPQSRRGSFAARVVEAERGGLISSSTAASYLDTEVETYEANRDSLADVLGLAGV